MNRLDAFFGFVLFFVLFGVLVIVLAATFVKKSQEQNQQRVKRCMIHCAEYSDMCIEDEWTEANILDWCVIDTCHDFTHRIKGRDTDAY